MEFSAHEINKILNGTIEGNPEVKVHKPSKIEDAESGDVCFLANQKYLKYAYSTRASILIVNEDILFDQPVNTTIIRVKDAYSAFAVILDHYKSNSKMSNGVEKYSYVSTTATIKNNVHIGAFSYVSENSIIEEDTQIFPHCYIGKNVKIGKHTTLFPGVIILDDCIIGNYCILNSGVVIGSDGFGFAPQDNGSYKKIAQTGNVVIEDDVEIGANTTIDRATMGSTLIKRGAKLDNLIQIAHNVEIGENTAIAAQSGISGSTKIGNNCIIGGQVGIVGHLEIADGTKINAQSGVSKSIKENNIALTGSPAFEYNSSMRSQVIFRKLPELMEKILDLEKRIKEIETGNELH